MRVLLAVAGLWATVTTNGDAQAPDSVPRPEYHAFYPGVNRAELIQTARSSGVEVVCDPIAFYPGFPVLCQTPGTLELLGSKATPAAMMVLAPMDSSGRAGFVLVVESPLGKGTQAWLDGQSSAWGPPTTRAGLQTQWVRDSFVMVIEVSVASRSTFVGYYKNLLAVIARAESLGVRAPENDSARQEEANQDAVTEALVDDPPQTLSCQAPLYPDSLRRMGVTGFARLQFVVETDGSVARRSAHVLSATHPDFGRAAAIMMYSCRFKPGRVKGVAVRVLVEQVINFAQ